MDEQLKQRVVGTAVIAVLVVVFVPMLLDGDGLSEPEPPRRINPLGAGPASSAARPYARVGDSTAPAADSSSSSGSFRSTVVSASDLTRAPPSTALAAKNGGATDIESGRELDPADAQLIAAQEREQVLSHARAVEQMRQQARVEANRRAAEAARKKNAAAQAEAARKSRSAAQKTPPPRTARAETITRSQTPSPSRRPISAKDANANFMIQLGAFGEVANAQRLKRELDKQGYRCVLQQLTIAGKSVTRVLVGPIRGRGEAERVRDSLAARTQLRAIVVSSS